MTVLKTSNFTEIVKQTGEQNFSRSEECKVKVYGTVCLPQCGITGRFEYRKRTGGGGILTR